MKNKIIIIALIVLGIILAVLVGFYFIRQNQAPVENQEKMDGGTRVNNQTNNEQSQNKLVTDDFEVTLPAGWEKTAPAMGTSAMAVNRNEKLDDPAAQKINFKSYFAVSYDMLQGKSLSEYLQTVKNQLSQTISNVVFANERDIMINGRLATRNRGLTPANTFTQICLKIGSTLFPLRTLSNLPQVGAQFEKK